MKFTEKLKEKFGIKTQKDKEKEAKDKHLVEIGGLVINKEKPYLNHSVIYEVYEKVPDAEGYPTTLRCATHDKKICEQAVDKFKKEHKEIDVITYKFYDYDKPILKNEDYEIKVYSFNHNNIWDTKAGWVDSIMEKSNISEEKALTYFHEALEQNKLKFKYVKEQDIDNQRLNEDIQHSTKFMPKGFEKDNTKQNEIIKVKHSNKEFGL